MISSGGASVAQVIKMMELQNDDRVDTLTVIIGTNDVSRKPVTPEAKWESLLICFLNELKENYRPRIVVPRQWWTMVPRQKMVYTSISQPVIQWINDAFRTRIEEMEAELRTTVNSVTRGSPAGRVRSHIPQALVNRLVPLTTEANVVQPSPSSDVCV